MKLFQSIFLIVIITLASCVSEVEKSPFPTNEVISGYWKLNKISKKGTQIPFNQYPSILTTSSLQNMYYSFQDNSEFILTFESIFSVNLWNGEWLIEKDTITLEFLVGVQATKYQIKSFSKEHFTVTDRILPDYELLFNKIENAEFPETLMSAQIDNKNFVATFGLNKAFKDGNYIGLRGDDNNDEILIIIYNPEDLKVGETYPIDGSIISSALGRGYQIYNGIEGKINVIKFSDDYIDITFQFKAKNANGVEVNITNGKFKAIIK
jgi:hypothetical protein